MNDTFELLQIIWLLDILERFSIANGAVKRHFWTTVFLITDDRQTAVYFGAFDKCSFLLRVESSTEY